MSRTTIDSQTALDSAVAELRDLLYSFWRAVVTEQSSFTKPLPEGSGRLDVDVDCHQGTEEIQVKITLKRGWRRSHRDGFTITPTNEFR